MKAEPTRTWRLRRGALAALGACCILLGPGCGQRQPTPEVLAALKLAAELKASQEAEATIRAAIAGQYAKVVTAIFANDFEEFRAGLDSTSRQDTTKCGATWAVVRLVLSVGGLKQDDFRIDTITVHDELNLAMVTTSHREKGEWKKDARPQVWVLEAGGWHWML